MEPVQNNFPDTRADSLLKNEAVVILDLKGNILEFNETAAQVIDLQPGKSLSLRSYSFLKSDDSIILPDELPWFISSRENREITFRNIGFSKKSTCIIWFSGSAKPLYNSEGTLNRILLSLNYSKNFSDRTFEAEKNSELKYRKLFENISEEVHFWKLVRDDDGSIKTWTLVDANTPALKTWGFDSIENIKDKTTDEIFGPGSTDHYMPVVQKIISEGKPYSYEDYFSNLDKYFRFISVPLGDYFITTGTDITQIKKLQSNAERERRELKAVIESSHDSMLVYNMEGKIILANKSFLVKNNIQSIEEMAGTADDMSKQFQLYTLQGNLVAPEDWPIRKVMKGMVVNEEEYKIVSKDGSYSFYLSFNGSPVFDENGKQILALTITKDITDKRLAEISLRESEERFHTLADNISPLVWMADEHGHNLWVNKRYLDYSGFSREDLENDITVIHHPDYIQAAKEKFYECISAGKNYEDTFPLKGKDGNYRWFLSRAVPVKDQSGKILHWFGTNEDITNERLLLEELKENQRKYEQAEELAHLGNFSHDLKTDLVEASREVLKIFGLNTNAKAVHWKMFMEKINPDDLKRIQKSEIALKPGKSFETEIRITTENGSVKHLKVYNKIEADSDGKPSVRHGAIMDITDRKTAELNLQDTLSELRKSESNLREAQQIAKMGMVEWDLVNETITWSDELFNIFERDRREGSPSVQKAREYMHPDDRARVKKELEEATEQGKETEFRIVLPGDKIKYIAYFVKPVLDEHGTHLKRIGLAQDITGRKTTELKLQRVLEDLKHSEAKLINAQKLANIGNVELDRRNGEIFWSEGMYQIFERDKALGPPNFEEAQTYIHPDDRAKLNSTLDNAKDSDKVELEFRLLLRGNKIKYIHYVVAPVFDASGNQIKRLGTIFDFTERKKIEIKLEETLLELRERLQEKEVLLRELYHRTKNNMQIISSLLNLRSATINNQEDRNIFLEMKNRIQAMSLVHERLYQSKNLSKLNLGAYIHDLVELLLISHTESREHIKVQFDLCEVESLLDTAIPCGFIITELVLNVIKYAFPDGRRGVLYVSLKRLDKNYVELKIADNGVGLSDENLNNEEKLGIQLVRSLTEDQLNGEVSVDRTNGVSWTIKFQEKLYHERV